jgi:hypothetical protein
MREVFLSHASQDQAKASRLRELLVAHSVPVWFSPHHMRGAQQWQDEIGEAPSAILDIAPIPDDRFHKLDR